jgi:hypothetical protein
VQVVQVECPTIQVFHLITTHLVVVVGQVLFKEDLQGKVTYLVYRLVKVTMGVVVQELLVLTLVKAVVAEAMVV